MSDLNEKIRHLGQLRETQQLQELIKSTDTADLINLVKEKIKTSNFEYTWNYLLQAFTNTSSSHQKRFETTLELLKQLQNNNISSSLSDTVINKLRIELNKFKSEHIAELCNYCLNWIQSTTSTNFIWKELLPELLNIIIERDLFEFEGEEHIGPEFKSNFINTLCQLVWSPSVVTTLTYMFIDTPLSREEHDQVVNKLCLYLEKLTPQEIPAFAYQILRLCKNTSVRLFFLRLQNYFGLRIYDQHRDSDSDLSEMVDGIESTSNQELIEAESTVLYHIHTSASLEHECIKNYISSLKNLLKSPEFVLHPFQLMLLFTIATVTHYEDPVFEIIRPCVVKCYQEEIKKNHSSWFRDMMSTDYCVEDVFAKVIHFSLNDRDLTLRALVNFAFVLLGIGSALGRDIMAEKQWTLGNMILLKIIKRKRHIAPNIIETLSNHIVTGHNVTQYIECIYILSRSYPLLMIENQRCIVELMEALIQIPGQTANHLLDAIIPLTKVSPTIRNHLIMLLRKALFSGILETRQVAVHGFLKLLTNLKISNVAVLSQSSNSSSSFASGHSLFTQLSLSRSSQANTTSMFSNEALCLEVLNILKRCFMQQADVKIKLYDGLYNAVNYNIELGGPVLDILWNHFKEFYVTDDEHVPPIKFDAVALIRDTDAILQEPLGKLIYVISLIVNRIDESDEETVEVEKFKSVLESLCRRMIQCELVHLELDDGTDLLDVLPHCQKKVCILKEAMCVYEALIGYKVLSWKDDSNKNIAQEINNLFQGYFRLLHFSKSLMKPKKDGRKKKGDDSRFTQNTTATSSQKKDSAQKVKNIKVPDTIFDYQAIIKLLRILNESTLELMDGGNANVIKTKREIHQHVMQSCLCIVQNIKHHKSIDTNYLKMQYESLTTIGTILYRRIVNRLSEFIDFDCTTAILAMECFQNILNIVSQNKTNFSNFLKKISNTEEGEDYLKIIIEVYQKLIKEDEDELSNDPEIKKLSGLVLNTLTILSQQIHYKNVALCNQLHDWLKQYAYNNKVPHKVSTVFTNLLFNSHIKTKISLTLFETVSIYLGDVFGVITEEAHESEKIEFINEGTVNNVLLCLCNSIKSELEDIDSIISRLKSEYNIITYPGEEKVDKKRENLQNKERGVCCQLCFIVTILTNLSNISLSAGNLAESVFKNLMSLFCTLTSLAKYFTLRSTKLNVAFQGARFERLVKLAGKQLAPVVYKFILHIEESQQQAAEATQGKKKQVDSLTMKSRVLRETRMIPKVVYEMEQFSKCVIKLSNKTKVDLSKYVGQGTVRDFRILKLKEVLEQADSSFVTTQATEMDTSHNDLGEENEESSDKENASDSDSNPPAMKKTKK